MAAFVLGRVPSRSETAASKIALVGEVWVELALHMTAWSLVLLVAVYAAQPQWIYPDRPKDHPRAGSSAS